MSHKKSSALFQTAYFNSNQLRALFYLGQCALAQVAGAAEALPLDFSNVLGNRKIVIERVAPHRSIFREWKDVFVQRSKGSSYRKSWVEIDPRKSFPANMSASQRECWFALSTGAQSCSLAGVRAIEKNIQGSNFVENTDLLKDSRDWVKAVGLRRTRDLMVKALQRLDADNSLFEKRLIKVRKNPDLVYDDSILTIPHAKRTRFGIFFALGYGHNVGLPSQIVKRMVKRAQGLGFNAKSFDTLPVGTIQENSSLINNELRSDLATVDSFILIGASKGGQELTHFYLNHLPSWSAANRAKLSAVVSMAGVLRSSYIADWVATAPGFRMDLLRNFSRLETHENKNLDSMRSTRLDAFDGYNFRILPKMHSNFVWVNFSMLPSGEDGHIPDSAILADYSRYAMDYLGNRGPTDGLVETAATVLPPGLGVRQWVVRGLGSHVPSFGNFVDGTSFAAIGKGKDDEVIASADRTMHSILRAMPQDPEKISH